MTYTLLSHPSYLMMSYTYSHTLHTDSAGECAIKYTHLSYIYSHTLHIFSHPTYILTPYIPNDAIHIFSYGVATICRLLKMTGLFCRIQSLS